ncbi:hypothetical protein R1flu_025727 [Riccia fluitans]|uniref:Beta-1,3-glucanase n=1 Tax=Riccia fluitans TaxID=41844 RepID=A0ABD1XYY8_9MARC
MGGSIGINFGQVSDELKSPDEIVDFLLRNNLKKIRLYHTYRETMRAFQGKGIELILSIPNNSLKGSGMAWEQKGADWWVQENIDPYICKTHISMVAVGNEVTLTGDGDLIRQTVRAMRHMRVALDKKGYDHIRVSTPLAMDILSDSWPPSAGTFKNVHAGHEFMRRLLEFLQYTRSTFLINAYPFFSYRDNRSVINLDNALLQPSASDVRDHKTGHAYRNLLFQQLDAVIAAMRQLGYPHLPLIISETGWPSQGRDYDFATAVNAQIYNQNLINIVAEGRGTPMRPGWKIEAYLFALFNENRKGGHEIERNFGLFRPTDLSPVYGLNFLC